jgi:hypothetical protein
MAGTVLLVAGNALAMTSLDYLQTIELGDLCIVNPENQHGLWIARVTDKDGHNHVVIVGSRIGKNFGVINKISYDTVEIREVIQEPSLKWVERTSIVEVGCHNVPPRCASSPIDGSHIVWIQTLVNEDTVHLGLSMGDRRVWRWVYARKKGIEPATSEEMDRLREIYGDQFDSDLDLSNFRIEECPTPTLDRTAQEDQTVSIKQLREEPDQWDEKRVVVRGAMSFKNGHQSICDENGCLILDLFKKPYTRETLDRDWRESKELQEQAMEGEPVSVHGTFDRYMTVPNAVGAGGLRQIMMLFLEGNR